LLSGRDTAERIMLLYIYIYICVCVCVYICMYVCMCVCVCVCVYIHIYWILEDNDKMFIGNVGKNVRFDPECHIPEDQNSRLHCYENLSSRVLQHISSLLLV
jgi:hypothetical protein